MVSRSYGWLHGCLLLIFLLVSDQSALSQRMTVGPNGQQRLGLVKPGVTSLPEDIMPVKPQVTFGATNQAAKQGPVFSRKSGMRVEIATDWQGEVGYLTYHLTFFANKPTPKDRRITVAFLSYSSTEYQATGYVEKEFLLKANQQEVSGDVLLPLSKHRNYNSFSVAKMAIDGKVDDTFSIDRNNFWGLTRLNQPRDRSKLLVLSPDRDPLPSGDPLPLTAASQLLTSTLPSAGDQIYEGLKEDWLAYTSFDAVKIRSDRLNVLKKESPSKWQAMMQWVAAGGNLWIVNVGSKPESLTKLTEQLNLNAWRLDTWEDERVEAPGAVGWQFSSLITKKEVAPPKTATTVEPKDEAKDANSDSTEETAADGDVEDAEDEALIIETSKGSYACYPYGMGRVYAFNQSEAIHIRGLSQQERQLFNQNQDRQAWIYRHGMSPDLANWSFANLLIPGVGTAPVVEFQVLITLFVLAIGPLNYWLLKRAERLHLLVLTTPLFASLLTLVLFGYSAYCDGFGVQVRARSVTLLNQELGEAVSWSRMTHYAGTLPKEGLLMPEGVALYPLAPSNSSNLISSATSSKTMKWEGKQQRLVSGYLPGRTTVQHLAVRNSKTNHRLDFLESSNGKLEVSNQLGAEIDLLLVQNELGDWSEAEQIHVNGKVVLKPTEFAKMLTRFRSLTIDNRPVMPVGAGDDAEAALRNISMTTYRRRNDNYKGNLSHNLMNQMIERLAGVDGTSGLSLPARSYVAVTSTAVETPLGTDSVTESGSFHLTVGRW